MKKKLGILCAIGASMVTCGLFAGEPVWTVQDGVATASGEGVITLDEPVELSQLYLNAEGEGLKFAGAEISFTDSESKVLTQSINPVQFDVPVSAVGNLDFAWDETKQITWNDGYLGTSSATAKILFENIDLNDYYLYSGTGGGESLTIGTFLYPYYIERGDGWLTAQLQAVNSGWSKCLKIRLEQVGENVKGWILYAKYLPVDKFGANYDEQGIGQTVAQSDSAYGYGVKAITLSMNASFSTKITITKTLQVAGNINIGQNLTLNTVGANVIDSDGAVTNNIQVAGTLKITEVPSLVFSSTLSGASGYLEIGGLHKEITQNEVDCSLLVDPNNWSVAAKDTSLSSVTSVVITAYSGMAIPTDPNPDGQTFNARKVDGVMEYQCQQIDGGWLKCVILQLRQNGDNVEAKLKSAWYTSASTPRGVDFDTLPNTGAGFNTKSSYSVGSNPNGYNYGIGAFKLLCMTGSLDVSENVQVTFAKRNEMTGATVIQNGGLVTITDKDGLPQSGKYTVNGGILELSATGCAIGRGISNGGTSIEVIDGVLRQTTACVFDSRCQWVTLDNSELYLNGNGTSGSRPDILDSNTYVNFLTMRNGSRITHNIPRILYSGNATWNVVKGDIKEVAWCEKKLLLASTSAQTLTLGVEDVTAQDDTQVDNSPDFILKDGFQTYDNTQHTNVFIRKTGAGMVSVEGNCVLFTPLQLVEGTMLFTKSDLFQMPIAINFEGGTLAFAAGTENTVGELYLYNDGSQLVLGEETDEESAVVKSAGLEVNVADSEGTETGKITLQITGPIVKNGKRTGLHLEQNVATADLKRLRYNGESVYQDTEGWICVGLRSTTIFVR